MFEGDRFTNVDSATQEWFPEVIAPEPESSPSRNSGDLDPLYARTDSPFFHTEDGQIFDYR